MGTQLNKEAYTKLINEDIDKLKEHMPPYSLEKVHIMAVLIDSVERLYPKNKCDEDNN